MNINQLTGYHVLDFRDSLQPLPLSCVLHATPTLPKTFCEECNLTYVK